MGNDTAELILSCSRGFSANELTVKDIQENIATLDVSGSDLPHPAQKRIVEVQRELDAIRWACAKLASTLRLSASSPNLNGY